jgi:hypothetical protein
MSVKQNHYEIIGLKFDYDKFFDEVKKAKQLTEYEMEDLIEPYRDNIEGIHQYKALCIIAEDMEGEYVYIGHVTKKSKNYGNLWDFKNHEKTPAAGEIQKMIKEQFGINRKCRKYTFTHYTEKFL